MNKHKQQTFWQIYFPLFLVVGIPVFLIILFLGKSTFNRPDLRIWSDISLLIILLPLLFFLIFSFIFLFLLIFIISRYQSALGKLFSNISDISIVVAHKTSNFMNKITQPLIKVESIISQLLPQKKE